MAEIIITSEGREFLRTLRLGEVPLATGATPPVRLIACVPSEECGCPEEVWVIDEIEALIHFEKNGSGEIILFGGEWDLERRVSCRNMADLRAAMFAVVAELETEEACDEKA